ncbi:hypothetical protein MKW94_018453 [Papaver nudicaule]|uniref:Ribosomal protein eL8/eL30/eS12/Gadd45 domain-containing protein n=1 Tax=Papaver nudicaule TaxID=74823 RepID=A0AA41S7W1_PAPNU|nr:hypothetical protein [Papaver nudicaule]
MLRILSRRSSCTPFSIKASTPALGKPMDIMTALHLGENFIEKCAAQLCVLAEYCNQVDYVKLVKALCVDHHVFLINVSSAKTLGEWAGVKNPCDMIIMLTSFRYENLVMCDYSQEV